MRVATVGFELGAPRSFGNAEYVNGSLAGNASSQLILGAPFDPTTVTIQPGRTGGKCIQFASQLNRRPEMPPLAIGRFTMDLNVLPHNYDVLPYGAIIFRGYFCIPEGTSFPRKDTVSEVMALGNTIWYQYDYYGQVTSPLFSLQLDEFGQLRVRHKVALASNNQSYYRPAWRSETLVKGQWYCIEAITSYGANGPGGTMNINAVRIDGVLVWSQCVARNGKYNNTPPIVWLGWGHVEGSASVSPDYGPGDGLLIQWDDIALNDLTIPDEQPDAGAQTGWPGPGRVFDCRPDGTTIDGDHYYGWVRGSKNSFYGGIHCATRGVFDKRIGLAYTWEAVSPCRPPPDKWPGMWYPSAQVFCPVGPTPNYLIAEEDLRFHLSLGATYDQFFDPAQGGLGADHELDYRSGDIQAIYIGYEVGDEPPTYLPATDAQGWRMREDTCWTHGGRDGWVEYGVSNLPPTYTRPLPAAFGPRCDIAPEHRLTPDKPQYWHENPYNGPLVPEGFTPTMPTFTFATPTGDAGEVAVMFAHLYLYDFEGDSIREEPRDETFEEGDPHYIDLPGFADHLDAYPLDFIIRHPFTGKYPGGTGSGSGGNRAALSPLVYNPELGSSVDIRFRRANPIRTYGKQIYIGMGRGTYGIMALVIEDGYEEQDPLPDCSTPVSGQLLLVV